MEIEIARTGISRLQSLCASLLPRWWHPVFLSRVTVLNGETPPPRWPALATNIRDLQNKNRWFATPEENHGQFVAGEPHSHFCIENHLRKPNIPRSIRSRPGSSRRKSRPWLKIRHQKWKSFGCARKRSENDRIPRNVIAIWGTKPNEATWLYKSRDHISKGQGIWLH